MAGPGTGKTFAVKRRVSRLLEEDVDPKRILAVTFTRTAAATLAKELKELGIPGCEKIQARTLHSFCFSVLSKRHVFTYLDRIAQPLVTFNKVGVMQFEGAPMLQDLTGGGEFGNKRNGTKRIRAFEAAWARLQSESPGWPVAAIDHEFHEALLDWLRFHKAMLIGELVPEALRYFRNNPACQELTAFDHVVVDEYQDLNKAEQVLLDLLASSGANAIIGDEDQSIYSFRHAHPHGIREYDQTHKGTRDENLLKCRRCPTRIVEMANYLIRYNHAATATPRLLPLTGNLPGHVHIVQWTSLKQEADGLARYVDSLIKSKRFTPADMLILSPRRAIGYAIRDALVNLKISTHSFYHEEALEDDQAQLAFTLLALLADKQDRVAMRFWLGYESPSWLEGQYRKLRGSCEKSGMSPWESLEKINNGELELDGVERLLKRFRDLQEILVELEPLDGSDLLDRLFPENQDWAKALREAALLKLSDSTNASSLLDGLRTVVTQPEMRKQVTSFA